MIDIIIPTYNRKKMLELTLRSILCQSFDLKLINVVIVDDGSNDNTYEVVLKYSKKLNLKYFYQEDRGYRVASARNMGLRNCNSNIFLLIDSGIMLQSQCVEAHVNFHRNFKKPISVVGKVYGFDFNNPDLKNLNMTYSRLPNVDRLINYFDAKKIYLDARDIEFSKYNYEIHELPAPWAFFWSGHVSVNKNCLPDEDLFDTNFEPRYGYEDVDLGFRLHQEGIPIFLLNEAKAFHFPHPKINCYAEDLKINSEVFYKKHNAEIIRLFNKHGGTFGFNELLLKNNGKSNKFDHCITGQTL